MSILADIASRVSAIGTALKSQGHDFGEELEHLALQLFDAEKPVVAEAEADLKQVGQDAVAAAEPVIAEGEADLTGQSPAAAPQEPETTPAPAPEEASAGTPEQEETGDPEQVPDAA